MAIEKQNLLLGLGELYFKRKNDASGKYRRVGNLKGTVTFSYEYDVAEQKPGDRLTIAKRVKTAERCSLVAEVADFTVAQLIPVLGLTISTSQLTGTTTIRIHEQLTLGASITTTTNLAQSAVSITSQEYTKLDQSVRYTRGTNLTAAIAKIRHLNASLNSAVINVYYDYKDTNSLRVRVGDDKDLEEVDLKFVHKDGNGKFIQIEIPIATIAGGLSIPFNETAFTTYGITFQGLGSTTAGPGLSLFKIIREV